MFLFIFDINNSVFNLYIRQIKIKKTPSSVWLSLNFSDFGFDCYVFQSEIQPVLVPFPSYWRWEAAYKN